MVLKDSIQDNLNIGMVVHQMPDFTNLHTMWDPIIDRPVLVPVLVYTHILSYGNDPIYGSPFRIRTGLVGRGKVAGNLVFALGPNRSVCLRTCSFALDNQELIRFFRHVLIMKRMKV